MLTAQAKAWIREQHKLTDGMSNEEMYTSWFFRNPARPETCDRNLVFTPADGFVTTLGRFDPEADLVDAKGVKCSVNDLLGPLAIESPALVFCVFMSALDCHWNRTPTETVMVRYPLPPIRTANVPMLFEERDILDDLRIKKADMPFMSQNERVVNVLDFTALKYRYYVVQIADSDVDQIVPMRHTQTAWFNQNERFGQIIWGSMCVLIMPLDARYRFRPLVRLGQHVECCHDPLVRIERG
jgi:phosphatidylserine decarboxylase